MSTDLVLQLQSLIPRTASDLLLSRPPDCKVAADENLYILDACYSPMVITPIARIEAMCSLKLETSRGQRNFEVVCRRVRLVLEAVVATLYYGVASLEGRLTVSELLSGSATRMFIPCRTVLFKGLR